MIQTVPEARRHLLAVLIVLLVLDVGAVALLLSPIGRSRATRTDEYNRVRAELTEKRREALPARDMDKKLETAREQVATFYKDRLPQRYSAMSEQLGKLAAANHIQIASIRYDEGKSERRDLGETPGTMRIQLDAQLTGDYINEMKFINALERSKLLFVVSSVNLGESQGGTVRLQVQFETFIRTGA